MAVKTTRLLAELKISESGSVASSGRSSPGGGRLRVRSTSVCSSVLPAAGDRDLGAEELACFAQRRLDLANRSDSAPRRADTRPAPARAARRRRSGGRRRSAPGTRAAGRAASAPRALRSSGLARTAAVYSTTARSKSCARSACSPARSDDWWRSRRPSAQTRHSARPRRGGAVSARASQPE